MKTMGKIYPIMLLVISLLFGSNTKVQAEQFGWLLRTASSVGVTNITTDAVSLGSHVFVFNGTSYTASTYVQGIFGQPDGWNADFVINAGEQFVFEMIGGSDGYLGWPYAYVGDWRLTAPTSSSVAGDVSIEWSAFEVSNISGNPLPSYAARVKIMNGAALVEDLGLIWQTESVVWHSQTVANGTYTIDITIVDSPSDGIEGVAVATITKQVNLDNSGRVDLMLSSLDISATVTIGSSPANQIFEVWGTDSLSYSISDNATWLSCSPISGLSSGEHDAVTVSFVTSGLSVGSYTGLISVVSAEASNSPQIIEVVLEVEPVALALSVSEMGVSVAEGGTPPDQAFEVWGTDSLTCSISDNVSWLSCSPTSGSSNGEHDSITVSFATSGLSVGSYTGLISVASVEVSNSPQTIEVVLDVASTAVLAEQFGWLLRTASSVGVTNITTDAVSLGSHVFPKGQTSFFIILGFSLHKTPRLQFFLFD